MPNPLLRNQNRFAGMVSQDIPDTSHLQKMRGLLTEYGVKDGTVKGAHCPNMGACWEKGAATF